MLRIVSLLTVFFAVSLSSLVYASSDYVSKQDIDFIHYQAELEPDFKQKLVQGKVNIHFKPEVNNLVQLSFSAKYKDITAVSINDKPATYQVENEVLVISTKETLEKGKEYVLTVDYSAKPKRGMRFFEDHLFTVYHTKNWLIAHNNISDKASFELALIHYPKYTAVSVGELVSNKAIADNKQISVWRQSTPIPIYTFGFALGQFESVRMEQGNNQIEVLYRNTSYSKLSKTTIADAFKNAIDMMTFFEQISGIEFVATPYQYLVVDGYMAQEVDGYSLVGEKFVHTLLENKYENWFIAHELAHEWWGNSITSANFSHFWLNEGLVQFLVAAYKERLFGKQAYFDEIDVAVRRVAKAVNENRTAPVAFRTEIAESDINRTMAYSKGALVFYMLRKEVGDELFWQALKLYSIKHKDGSVTTQDLKIAFEKTTAKDLTEFFDTWVYGVSIPTIKH